MLNLNRYYCVFKELFRFCEKCMLDKLVYLRIRVHEYNHGNRPTLRPEADPEICLWVGLKA